MEKSLKEGPGLVEKEANSPAALASADADKPHAQFLGNAISLSATPTDFHSTKKKTTDLEETD